MQDSAKKVYLELLALWLVVLLSIRLVVFAHSALGIHEIILGVVPLLFVYAPVWLCNYRKVDSYAYFLYIPNFTDFVAWAKAVQSALILNVITWSGFVPLYYVYYTMVVPQLFPAARVYHFIGVLPKELLLTVLYQIFYVAIPEEFFYRGYFQTRLNEIHTKKIQVFGVPMGMGVVYSNLFFAFGHSIVQFQWWHFATFFPGLLFSWSREKNQDILSGALFHASCNIGIVCLDTMFGLRSPL
jgi:membrane protease YdiL (CAAX protease family)